MRGRNFGSVNVAFLVTGHGRSGTCWLAGLLDRSPGVRVYHEPIPADIDAHARIRNGTLDAGDYLERRRAWMEEVWRRHPAERYAESNSYLRYCARAAGRAFGAPVAALVRDGRLVVRSMLARGCYQRPGYPPIPAEEGVTPLEKCAWYWADSCRRLADEKVPFFRLEDLNADRDAYEILCRFLGVYLVASAWYEARGRAVNVGVGGEPLDWGAAETDAFLEMAGDVFARYYGDLL